MSIEKQEALPEISSLRRLEQAGYTQEESLSRSTFGTASLPACTWVTQSTRITRISLRELSMRFT